jgi:hypothetical protein
MFYVSWLIRFCVYHFFWKVSEIDEEEGGRD